jgi:hypothetical protein
MTVNDGARRLGCAALAAVALLGLAACGPTTGPAVQATSSQASGVRIHNIQVDTSALVAQSGNPTAAWVQQALPAALAQLLAADLAPDDTGAPTLTVRVKAVVLGPIGPEGGAIDTIRGQARLGGGPSTKIKATTFYTPSPVDQSLWEQALQGRVTTLATAFAQTLQRKLGR